MGMKNLSFLKKSFAALLFISFPSFVSAQAVITLLHPSEGQHLPEISGTFVYGQVTPGATLTINGMAIPVHPNGGYLVVPVNRGSMTLSCDVKAPKGETAHLARHFAVDQGLEHSAGTAAGHRQRSLEPEDDLELMPGDSLRVYFQGSPHGKATFAISGSSITFL